MCSNGKIVKKTSKRHTRCLEFDTYGCIMKIKKSQKIKRRSALGMKGEIVMAFKFEKDKFYMPAGIFWTDNNYAEHGRKAYASPAFQCGVSGSIV